MAIDPPTATQLKSITLDALCAELRAAESAAALIPVLRAELAERMSVALPGQKLVRARKAKGAP